MSGSCGEALDDLDELALADRQRAHRRVRRDRLQLQRLEQRLRAQVQLAREMVPTASARSTPNQMFSATVRSGISDNSWKIGADAVAARLAWIARPVGLRRAA